MKFASGGRRLEKLAGSNPTRRESTPRKWRTITAGNDPWYTHLYRTSHAYHGVHPFYMWYWGAHGRDYAGDVIFVGGDPKSVARLGYRTAGTFRDALEMAKDTVGSSPSITYMHTPPLSIADVK